MRVLQNIVKPTSRMRKFIYIVLGDSAKIIDDKKACNFQNVSQRLWVNYSNIGKLHQIAVTCGNLFSLAEACKIPSGYSCFKKEALGKKTFMQENNLPVVGPL